VKDKALSMLGIASANNLHNPIKMLSYKTNDIPNKSK
jgi:hypothetical protein